MIELDEHQALNSLTQQFIIRMMDELQGGDFFSLEETIDSVWDEIQRDDIDAQNLLIPIGSERPTDWIVEPWSNSRLIDNMITDMYLRQPIRDTSSRMEIDVR